MYNAMDVQIGGQNSMLCDINFSFEHKISFIIKSFSFVYLHHKQLCMAALDCMMELEDCDKKVMEDDTLVNYNRDDWILRENDYFFNEHGGRLKFQPII